MHFFQCAMWRYLPRRFSPSLGRRSVKSNHLPDWAGRLSAGTALRRSPTKELSFRSTGSRGWGNDTWSQTDVSEDSCSWSRAQVLSIGMFITALTNLWYWFYTVCISECWLKHWTLLKLLLKIFAIVKIDMGQSFADYPYKNDHSK